SGYIVLGQALYETGQLDEARSTFETALGLDPENLIGLRQLGDIARAKGDMSGARGWYRRLLEVDPQNDEVEAVLREIDAPAAAAAAAPPAATSEPPASKALDFDYDVLSAFGEAESKPSEQSAPAEAGREEPAPVASQPEAVHAAPAPVVVPAPAPIEGVESASDEPLPAAFITETMAELYLQQGHREQALDIYRLLLAQRPTDVSLLNRIARLEQPSPAAPVERTVRAFFGRFANRRPPGVRTETDIPVVATPAQPEPSAPEPSSGDEPHPLGEAVEAQAPAQASEPEVQVPSETEPAAPGRDEPSIADFAPAESSAESSAPEPVAAPEPAAVAAPHEPEPLHERALASDRMLSFAEL